VRRFEVWRLVAKDTRGSERLVMILQSEKIDHLATVIVAPLRSQSSDMVVPNLTPSIDIEGTAYTVLVPLMTAIDRKQLGTRVLDGGGLDYEIGRALDRVFSGV
jgi:toxin CcdB